MRSDLKSHFESRGAGFPFEGLNTLGLSEGNAMSRMEKHSGNLASLTTYRDMSSGQESSTTRRAIGSAGVM